MNNDKFEFADLAPVEVQKIKQAEQQIKNTENEEIILLAYKKH